jgi:amino acid transporter
VIYILVSICAVALVPVGDLSDPSKGSALTQVVRAGAPGLPFDRIFPFIGMFAVANSALINMLMASRLLYGLARQGVLPHALGIVHPVRRTPWVAILFTTALAFGLIYFVVTASQAQAIGLLGGTTALLLLGVFTIVNVALIVLRRRPDVEHEHFRSPGPLPYIGAVSCAFLVGPWARSEGQMGQYRIAAWLLAVGVVLWRVTWGGTAWCATAPAAFSAPSCSRPDGATPRATDTGSPDRSRLGGRAPLGTSRPPPGFAMPYGSGAF